MKELSSGDSDFELGKLAQDASTEDQNDSFMEPKKKRGRPKGSKNSTRSKDAPSPPKGAERILGGDTPPTREEQIAQTKKYIKPVVGIISNVGVKIAEDPAAAMGPDEAEIIAESAAACIQQYLPDVLGAHANAVVLLTALGNWSLRVYLLRMANLEAMREKARAARVVNASSPESANVN